MAYLDDYVLAQTDTFVQRITVAALTAAQDIMNEDPETARHESRLRTARFVTRDPVQWGRSLALVAAAGGTLSGVSTDQELYSRVSAIWNSLPD